MGDAPGVLPADYKLERGFSGESGETERFHLYHWDGYDWRLFGTYERDDQAIDAAEQHEWPAEYEAAAKANPELRGAADQRAYDLDVALTVRRPVNFEAEKDDLEALASE